MAGASTIEAQQTQIAAVVRPLVSSAVQQVSFTDLDTSLSLFSSRVAGVTRQYGRLAAVMGLRWYQKDRAANGAPGRVNVKIPAAPTPSSIVAALDIAELLEADNPASVATKVADDVAATVDQIALTQGDQAIQGAIELDKYAIGYARGLEPGACAFCSMLASRGAVYKTRGAAELKVHKRCRCYPIVIYKGQTYKPGPREQRAIDLWQTAVRDRHLTGRDARRAYRAAIEGREYIPGSNAPKSSQEVISSRIEADLKMTPEHRAELIAKLRRSEAACKRSGLTATLMKVRERISQLELANIEQRRRAA